MASISTLLQDIDGSADGPAVAAIFDFDGTVIAGYSATAFIREQIRRGDISARDLVEIMSAMTSFGLGNLVRYQGCRRLQLGSLRYDQHPDR